jgi:hypothetical protein
MHVSAPHHGCRVPLPSARDEENPSCPRRPLTRHSRCPAHPPPLSPTLERSSVATAAMDGHRGQSHLAPMASRVAAKPRRHRPGNSPYALYTLDRGRSRCHSLMAAAAMTGRRQRACRGCRWLAWPRYLEPSQGKLWPQANARWPRHARAPPLAAGELQWWPNRCPLFRPLLRPPQRTMHAARPLRPSPGTVGASRKCTLFSRCYTAVLVGLRASQHRCHRATAVAVACSCGHGAMDCLGPSRAALRVRKGTLELVPPLATAAGDPLAGDQPESTSPALPSGGRRGVCLPLCLSVCVYDMRGRLSSRSHTSAPLGTRLDARPGVASELS